MLSGYYYGKFYRAGQTHLKRVSSLKMYLKTQLQIIYNHNLKPSCNKDKCTSQVK